MFGLNFMCDILSGPTCLIKGVIYLRIIYQLIKSPNTLIGPKKFGYVCLLGLGQMLTRAYLIKKES